MMKSTELLQLAESFYKKALWSQFAAQSLLKTAEDDLLEEYEQFDIKDKELFEQLEQFIDTYKEWLQSLKPTKQNLTEEGQENSMQLTTTLNTKAERIFNNSYLQMDESKGYDEDFSPADLLTFVQKVIDSANGRVEDLTGMKIDEATALQFKNMVNAPTEKHQEGRAEDWSAEKTAKALEYRQTWLKKIRWAGKHGKLGEWEKLPEEIRSGTKDPVGMWNNYITWIRNKYKAIMADPEKKAAYREASRSRQRGWYGRETPIIPGAKPRQEVVKERARKHKEQKEKGDFTALVLKLKMNVPNIKRGDKKVLLDREADRLISAASAAEQTTYKPYLDKIAAAKQTGNKQTIHAAIVELQIALNDVVEQFEHIKRLVNQYEVVTTFRERVKKVDDAGIMKKDSLSQKEREVLMAMIAEGNRIMVAPGIRPSTINLVEPILQMMANQLTETSGEVQTRIAPEEELGTKPKVRVETIDPETGVVEYEEMEEEEFKPAPHRRILRGHMKQRKEKLDKLIKKEAQVENLPETDDPNEFAHQVFQKLLADLAEKLKKST